MAVSDSKDTMIGSRPCFQIGRVHYLVLTQKVKGQGVRKMQDSRIKFPAILLYMWVASVSCARTAAHLFQNFNTEHESWGDLIQKMFCRCSNILCASLQRF